jgi:hypothetical protein
MRPRGHHLSFDQSRAGLNAIKARVDAVEPVGMFRQYDVNVGDVAPHLSHSRFEAPCTCGHFGHGLTQRIDFGVDAAEIAKDQIFGFISHRLKIVGSAILSTSARREHAI